MYLSRRNLTRAAAVLPAASAVGSTAFATSAGAVSARATIDPRTAPTGPAPRMSWIGGHGLHTSAGRVIDLGSIPYQLSAGSVVQGSYVVGTVPQSSVDGRFRRAYRITSAGRVIPEWGFDPDDNRAWVGTTPHTGAGGPDRFVTLYTDGFEGGAADICASTTFDRQSGYFFDGYSLDSAALAFHDQWIWRRTYLATESVVRLDRYHVRTKRVEVIRRHTHGLAAHPATGRAAYRSEDGRTWGVVTLDGGGYGLDRAYTAFDFSPSGALLACAARDGLDVRRAATGALVRRYRGRGIGSMAWESDDALLLRAQGGVYRSLLRVTVGAGRVERVTGLRRDNSVFPLRRY